MKLIELGLLPDRLLRAAIRRISRGRLKEQKRAGTTAKHAFLRETRQAPIAVHPDAANAQHYEVPAEFYRLVLGPQLKYSSCWWDIATDTLAQAETNMLERTMARAELDNGQRILELGCGWGSLTLAMAARYPAARITAVSNSASQRQYIEAQARERDLQNIQVITADMNAFIPQDRFDRIVSVEMFEHMRNHRALLSRVREWLSPDGKLFVHIFCHDTFAYPYEVRDATDWMAEHFFTGGMMPSFDWFELHNDVVEVEQAWRIPGSHYEKTANAWLANLDTNRERVLALFRETYGADEARKWFNYWRVFFMACAEMFGYRDGQEWYVGHYLMRPAQATHAPSDGDDVLGAAA